MQGSDAVPWVKIRGCAASSKTVSAREGCSTISLPRSSSQWCPCHSSQVIGESRSRASLPRAMLRSENHFARTSRSRSDLSFDAWGATPVMISRSCNAVSIPFGFKVVLESISKFLKFTALRAPWLTPAEDLLNIHEVQLPGARDVSCPPPTTALVST